jgi:hypothetical protein
MSTVCPPTQLLISRVRRIPASPHSFDEHDRTLPMLLLAMIERGWGMLLSIHFVQARDDFRLVGAIAPNRPSRRAVEGNGPYRIGSREIHLWLRLPR